MYTVALQQPASPIPAATPITSLNLALSLALRPSRLRLALARLELLLRTCDQPPARGLLGLATFCLTAFGTARLLFFLSTFGWRVTAFVAAHTTFGVLASLLGGVGLLALACASAGDELDRGELETGALLNLGPAGLCVTVRGTTVYYDWRLVRVVDGHTGLLLVLPRRTFHLVPRAALVTFRPRELRDLLLEAGAKPFGGARAV